MKNYYVVYVDNIGEVGDVFDNYEDANEYHSGWLNDISSSDERKNNSYIVKLHTTDKGDVVGSETVMVWEGDNA